MKHKLTRAELKEKLRPWMRALTNPHLLISVGIAWFITNGWAYCATGIGWYADIPWLLHIGTVWLGILWMPGTPEKLFTFAIAIGILKLLFPEDTRTLAMIHRKRLQLTERTKVSWQKFRARFRRKKN
ncbi:MAG: hypothetical protein IKQ91_06375 [Oscillospiraceae bacterium]|nr:hypothetical protein [Oscillospiraceae bacterium]